jgi:uncharacterized lipoprotein YbaY
MKLNRVLGILSTILFILVVTVACSKSEETAAPVENPVTTQEPSSPVQQATEGVTQPSGPPEDVPIMPDAYELEIANKLNLGYKVALPIADVVAFYQEELPKNGWDQINNPDSVIGSMAQLTRSKTNGDRVTFSLQFNPIGEFTVLQIYITRAP